MPRNGFIFSTILLTLTLLIGAGPTLASEKSSVTATASESAEPCQKKLGVKGRPHKFNTVASLNAVRAWTQKAMQYGELYAMWHKAEGSNIKCSKLPRSEYFVCYASGKPCLASADEKTAARTN